MSFFHALLSVSGGGEEPQYTNWWQGIGDVVPLSDTYTIYDPLAAEDLASSYVNLANPGTRNASLGTAPAHAQGTGWTFTAASSQYLKTSTLGKDNQTVIIWVEGASGVYAIGFFTNSGGLREQWIRPVNSSTTAFRRQAGTVSLAGATTGGVLGISKTNAYKNGIDVGNLNAWVGADGLELYIGCHNSNGSPANYFGGKVLRVGIYDFELSAAQVEAVIEAMIDYNQPAVDSYSSAVLALNPICYAPCNQAIGSVCLDISGNKAHLESFNLPVGQVGLKGLSIAGDGNAANAVRTVGDWTTLTGIDIDEFWFSCLIKVDLVTLNQIRVMNMYSTGQNEYFAVEIRGGANIGIFCKEQTELEDTSTITTVVDETWHHMVCYNSLSNGKFGLYLDGVKYEYTKTLPGFGVKTVEPTYPYTGQDLAGNVQHIAYFSGFPTQEQVNSLGIS